MKGYFFILFSILYFYETCFRGEQIPGQQIRYLLSLPKHNYDNHDGLSLTNDDHDNPDGLSLTNDDHNNHDGLSLTNYDHYDILDKDIKPWSWKRWS